VAKAEILSIGTELLLGQILNSNSQFLSAELAELGIDCLWHSTVGDNKDRIKEALRTALGRVDIVLTTGGLGPTVDDLTMECLSELFAVPMVFDDQIMADIQSKFGRRGMRMPESNRKQALRPEGSRLLPNEFGTAPGVIWELGAELIEAAQIGQPERLRVILTFPGVPSEMRSMWKATARPYLTSTFGDSVIWSCDLKHYGIGESALAEMHSEELGSANPTVAPLAGRGECRLRVTAKAPTLPEAKAMAQPVIERIRAKSGTLCYGIDDDKLESVVGDLLAARGLTVAFAESCTGGLVSKKLTDIPGSSRYVKLNIVSYSNQAKEELLGVHEYILNAKGAVSAESAHAMATGIKRLARCDIGVAVTGIAGPDGGTAEKPVGLVYLALVAEHFQADKRLKFPPEMGRSEIRHRTASEALNMVRLFLLDPAKLSRTSSR